MDIGTKSTGFLIDQLITTSMRCWYAQEDIMNPEMTDSERLEAAIRAQQQNSIRSQLIKAIDERLGESGITMGQDKTYHTYQDKK
jgi:1,2-phenylacetyl-CoA epoxidase catalytic subunit